MQLDSKSSCFLQEHDDMDASWGLLTWGLVKAIFFSKGPTKKISEFIELILPLSLRKKTKLNYYDLRNVSRVG